MCPKNEKCSEITDPVAIAIDFLKKIINGKEIKCYITCMQLLLGNKPNRTNIRYISSELSLLVAKQTQQTKLLELHMRPCTEFTSVAGWSVSFTATYSGSRIRSEAEVGATETTNSVKVV